MRGLKLSGGQHRRRGLGVAPLAGAWIETPKVLLRVSGCVGSHPSRVRGLKLLLRVCAAARTGVAPLAGAWIETGVWEYDKGQDLGRTPRGCVD